jgi:hypothetical protein
MTSTRSVRERAVDVGKIRRYLRTGVAGSLLFGGLTAGSLVARSALTPSVASADPVDLFSSTTPGFVANAATVPSGVCYVEVTATGGTGGLAFDGYQGAGGGTVTARVLVTPAERLSAEIGGDGEGDDLTTGGTGGIGGGGGGAELGGGGAGASVVSSSSGVPLVVAGGGGGGGTGAAGGAGGAGGASIGNGAPTAGNPNDDGGGGGGVTSTSSAGNGAPRGGGGNGLVGGGGAGGGAGGVNGGAGGSGSGAPGSGGTFVLDPGPPIGPVTLPTGQGGPGDGAGGNGGASGAGGPGGGGAGGVGFGGGGGGGGRGDGGGGGGYSGGAGGGDGGGGGTSYVIPTATSYSSSAGAVSGGAQSSATISSDSVADACTTTVVIPSNNAFVSGTSQLLDASATTGATQVQYEITGGSLTGSIVATADPTIYGWIGAWNTTTVPNGLYSLQSVATYPDGSNVPSAAVAITVNNAAPTTAVIVPSSGAAVAGPSQTFDATASSGVTTVQYQITGGSLTSPVVVNATPTIYGWLASWNTTTVDNGTYAIVSVATYSGGVSGTSPPVPFTLNNPPPTTMVVIPSAGAEEGGTSILFDASASPGVTSVTFQITNVGGGILPSGSAPSKPTIYGWLSAIPYSGAASSPGECVFAIPYSVQSVATYAGGVMGISAPVNFTIETALAC